ncbi:MAG TPA: CDP-alcohol phosphatidyltransferase family protein [Gemmatimonadaceae bacterium]|nr:CDP-alcohol phosphatidyltransferase family protein [Gemmatimonadaceae bacterium]
MPFSFVVFLAIVGGMLLSMVVYAARGAKPDPDAERKKAQFAGGAADFILHWFIWFVAPAATWSVRVGLTPEFYNFLGLGFGIASGAALAVGQMEIAGWALVLSGVCDIMDGRIARATKTTSKYGAFIDAVLDRFTEVAFFIGFAIFLRHSPHGAIAATLALGSSLLVSYARAVGETLGVDCTGGLMQRGERLALLSIACLVDRVASPALGHPIGTVLLGVMYFIGGLSMITAVHRSVWIAQQLRSV